MYFNAIVHYSTWPKPMALLMGTVSHGKESSWSCADGIKDHQFFNDPDQSLSARADYFADMCFTHHWDRIATKTRAAAVPNSDDKEKSNKLFECEVLVMVISNANNKIKTTKRGKR